jgi:hypothetical protein
MSNDNDISFHINEVLSSRVNNSFRSGEFFKEITPTTAKLINFWFDKENTLERSVNFYDEQKQIILNIIYLGEIENIDDFENFYKKIDVDVFQSFCYASLRREHKKLLKKFPDLRGFLEERSAEIACGNFQNFFYEKKSYKKLKDKLLSGIYYDCLYNTPFLPEPTTGKSWIFIAISLVQQINSTEDYENLNLYRCSLLNADAFASLIEEKK